MLVRIGTPAVANICSQSAAGYTNYQPSKLDPSVKVSVPHTKRSTGNPSEGVPKEAVAKLREALGGLYPELAAMTFTDSRLCWCAAYPSSQVGQTHILTYAH